MVIKFHSYNAVTYLFIDINLNEEFIFHEARKLINESIKEIAEKTTYPPLDESIDNEDFNFQIEDVIDPIINIFNDTEGRECLAVNFGFCSFNSESLSNTIILEQIGMFNKKILTAILMHMKRYEFWFKVMFVGICLDSSYVEKIHQDLMKKILGKPPLIFSLGMNNITDQYYWVMKQKIYESSTVYKIFPKFFITLPIRDSFSLDLKPTDLLGIKSRAKSKKNSEVKRNRAQEKREKRLKDFTEELGKFLNYLDNINPLLISIYQLDFISYKLNEYKELAEKHNFSSFVDKLECKLSKNIELICVRREKKKKEENDKRLNEKIKKMEDQLKLLRRQKELEDGDIIVKLNKENLERMNGQEDYKQELKDVSKEIIDGMENKIKIIAGAKKQKKSK